MKTLQRITCTKHVVNVTVKKYQKIELLSRQKKRTLPDERVLFKEWIGVEPTNDGFADQSLTAWVPLQKVVQI